jgi:hypothetical protein
MEQPWKRYSHFSLATREALARRAVDSRDSFRMVVKAGFELGIL